MNSRPDKKFSDFLVVSSSLSERIKKEEEDRNKMIQQENQRISDEFQARQEILRAAENKRLRQIEEEKQKIEARKKFLHEERERVEEQIKLEAARKAEEMAKEQRNLDEQRKLEMKKMKELEKQRILETKKTKVEETSTIKRKVDQSMRAVTASPQVTRRSDDIHGRGFGQVKTGHVMSTKISFYNRAASQERDVSATPEPKRKFVHFLGDDSPRQSPNQRPVIKTGDVAANVRGWAEKVKDHETRMFSPVPFKSEQTFKKDPSPPLPPPPSQ